MRSFSLKTRKRCELVDITEDVAGAVRDKGVKDGIVVIYCPHTTAGITINEDADPAVCRDILMKTSKVVEEGDPEYRHGEGNSDSHVKSSLVGASETIIVENGKLVLGTWQGIYFCEFDGPRTRNFFLKILAG